MTETAKNFCINPWRQLSTLPTGEVKPCCIYEGNLTKENGEDFNLNTDSLSEIIESQALIEIRKTFQQGDFPVGCKQCLINEQSSKESKREIDNKKLAHLIPEDLSVESSSPKYLSLQLGITCNLKCRICCSDNSSKWLREDLLFHKPKKAYHNINFGNWASKKENLKEEFKSILSEVEYIDFTGGEPFLIKEHIEILEECIRQGVSKNIDIHYNTNGTIYPKHLVEEIWPKFRLVEVMVSIDGIKDRFYYQRYPAKWNIVEENLLNFHQNKNIHTTVCQTVSTLNFWYASEVIDFCNKHQIPLWLNDLHAPDYFNIQNLPKIAKEKLTEKMNSYTPSLKGTYNESCSSEISSFIKRMNSFESHPHFFKMFYEHIDRHDQYRNESFEETFREWNKVLEQSEYNFLQASFAKVFKSLKKTKNKNKKRLFRSNI